MALKGGASREGAGDNEEVVEDEEEVPSRESAVEAAWAEHEEPVDEGEETPVETAEEPVEEEEPAKEEKPAKGKREKDPKTGKFLKAKAPVEGEPVVEKTPEELEAEAAAAEEQQKLPQERQTVKPLLSWRPLEREALNKVAATPEGKLVLAAVQRREAQVEGALKETQGIREFTNGFSRVMAPHQPLLTMLKVHPLDAVGELMRSAAVIYQGDAHLKAREVASLIKNRGIDVDLLADYLEGITPKNQPNQDPRVEQLTQQVQQLTSHLQGNSQAEDQRLQEAATAKVAAWSKDKPFFEDVRGRMRTLISAGDADGQELSLDEAYAIACSMDPQISKLVEQKKAADGLKARQDALAKARKAGKSPRPDGSRRPSGTPTGDRTTDIESAWEEVEGR